ncbi:hypothetical protein ACEPAH_4192 [Sanghuangporus vaninii]
MASFIHIQSVDSFEVVSFSLYAQAAAASLLSYDAALKFHKEVRFMWSRPFNSGKILYFLIKYITIFSFVPAAASAFSQRIPWLASVIVTMLTEITLQLRLYALYSAKKSIKIVLMVSLAITIIPMLAICFVIMRNESGAVFLAQGTGHRLIFVVFSIDIMQLLGTCFVPLGINGTIQICLPSDATKSYLGFWVPALFNEAFLFSLAAYKGLEVFKEQRQLGFTNRLKRFLVKGSVMYFFVVFAKLLVAEVLWLSGGVNYVPLSAAITAPVASLMSQSLLLGLRERYERSLPGSSSQISNFVAPQGIITVSLRASDRRSRQTDGAEVDWLISFGE